MGGLDLDTKGLASLQQSCKRKAEDFKAEQTSRGEELKAIAAAQKAVAEMTGGAEAVVYGLNQVSFLQTSSANADAVRYVSELAKKQHAPELAQLAKQMASAV